MTTSADVPFRLPVAIDGRAYEIDVTQYSRSTLPINRGQLDSSVEPGEQTITAEGTWRRSQESWIDGAGQEYFDSLPGGTLGLAARLRTRFWKSKGVDPFAHDGQLSLLRKTELKKSNANITQVLFVGNSVYYTDGAVVEFATNALVGGTPTWNTLNLGGKTPVWLTTNGTLVYIACTDSVRSGFVASTTTNNVVALGAAPQRIAYCNGRLIVATSNILSEITATPSVVAIGSNPNSAFRFTDITSAPNAIYACGSAGSFRSEIYSVDVDAATGALTTPVLATELPNGETINAMKQYGGFMAMATSNGVRMAQISRDDHTLHYGPLIDFFGESKCLDAFGQFINFGVPTQSFSNYNDASTLNNNNSAGIARLNLGRFNDDLVPAYALDVQTPDGNSGACISVTTAPSGQRLFAIAGVGLFGEHPTKYTTDGQLQSGFIRYGTSESKTLIALEWRHDGMLGNSGSVGMSGIFDLNTSTISTTPTSTGTGSTLNPETAGNPILGEWVKLQLYLTRDATTDTVTPVVRRWTAKAIVAPQRQDEIIVPIILKAEVPTHNGSTQFYDTRIEYIDMKAYEQSGAIIDYQEGDTTYKCKVDRVELKPERWRYETDGTVHFDGLMVVRLLTVPMAA
jgi:hypothetical protein